MPAFPNDPDYATPSEETVPPYYSDKIYQDAPRSGDGETGGRLQAGLDACSAQGGRRLDRPQEGPGTSSTLPGPRATSCRDKTTLAGDQTGDGFIVQNLSVEGLNEQRLSRDSQLGDGRQLKEASVSGSTVMENVDAMSSEEDNENIQEQEDSSLDPPSSGSVSVSGMGPIEFWNSHSQDSPSHAPTAVHTQVTNHVHCCTHTCNHIHTHTKLSYPILTCS